MDLNAAFEIMALKGILEEAYNGLKWYRDAHPEDDSPADDELYERIERALESPDDNQPE